MLGICNDICEQLQVFSHRIISTGLLKNQFMSFKYSRLSLSISPAHSSFPALECQVFFATIYGSYCHFLPAGVRTPSRPNISSAVRLLQDSRGHVSLVQT